MAKLQSPFGTNQFFNELGAIANSYRLYTYITGTTTNKTTYTDQAGTTSNANPIILGTDGGCSLWLDTGEYTFVLKTPGLATVPGWPKDDIAGLEAASAIPYVPVAGLVTMTGLLTLSGNASAALNPTPLQQVTALIAAATPAASAVPIADAGGYYTGTSVEAALQEAAVFTGRLLAMQVFTASGTWTKPAGCTTCIVEVKGAGGGSFSVASGGGGGGEGGTSRRRVTSPGATETVTIGAGGAVNAAGGASSFGSFATGNGGAAGGATDGGLGGTAVSGDLNKSGEGGGYGGAWSANNYFGHGGGGAPGALNRAAGVNAGANTGGGGSGGSSTGGTGGSGYVIVWAYS